MPDIATVWDVANARGDWLMAGPSLQAGGDLATAVLISVFTDRTASPDDTLSDGSTDPRGWWGDQGQDFPIGSKVWLYARAKQTDETLQGVKDAIAESLAWMIADQVCARIEVFTEWTRPSLLGARVTLHRADGTTVSVEFSKVWLG